MIASTTDDGSNEMKERHEAYFIRYEDKDSGWEETFVYRTDDDLKTFIRRAEELVEEGHRNVRVMEEVVVERLVREVR